MRNLIIDGAAGGETKRRHDVTFPLLTLHREKIVYIFLQDFSKKKTLSILVSCTFVRKTDDILRTLLLMHDGVRLIKSNQNKWVILGHELTENNVRK
jgi:hypothetical protein